MILKYGICGICDKTEIGKYNNVNFVPNDNYCELHFMLNDMSVATHGICKECMKNINTRAVLDVFGRIKETWVFETINRGGSNEYIRYVEKLKVVSYLRNNKQVIIKNGI